MAQERKRAWSGPRGQCPRLQPPSCLPSSTWRASSLSSPWLRRGIPPTSSSSPITACENPLGQETQPETRGRTCSALSTGLLEELPAPVSEHQWLLPRQTAHQGARALPWARPLSSLLVPHTQSPKPGLPSYFLEIPSTTNSSLAPDSSSTWITVTAPAARFTNYQAVRFYGWLCSRSPAKSSGFNYFYTQLSAKFSCFRIMRTLISPLWYGKHLWTNYVFNGKCWLFHILS